MKEEIPEGATHKHEGNRKYNPHFIRVVGNSVFASNVSGLGMERWIEIKQGFGVEGWTDSKCHYKAV